MVETKKYLDFDKNKILDYYNRPNSLYCKRHNRICEKNYNNPPFENFIFFQILRKCDICKFSKLNHELICNYDDYLEKKKNKDNFKNIELWNEKFRISKNKIYHFLMNYFESFKILIGENKEINKISSKVKKDCKYVNFVNIL